MVSWRAGMVTVVVLLSACAGPAADTGEPTATDQQSASPAPSTTHDPGPTTAPASPGSSGPAGFGPAGFGPAGFGPAGFGPAGFGPAGFGPSRGDGTRVIVDASEFGPMLYSARGQAICLFDLEAGPRPHCYRQCAADWPPVLTTGGPVAGKGVRTGLLGTTRRVDGRIQVTYAGHPLYFYAHEDTWQVLCHDFEEYGGTWYVVRPDGEAAP